MSRQRRHAILVWTTTIKRYDVASIYWLRLLITLLLLSGLAAPSLGAEVSYVPQIEYLRTATDNKLTASEALASDMCLQLFLQLKVIDLFEHLLLKRLLQPYLF